MGENISDKGNSHGRSPLAGVSLTREPISFEGRVVSDSGLGVMARAARNIPVRHPPGASRMTSLPPSFAGGPPRAIIGEPASDLKVPLRVLATNGCQATGNASPAHNDGSIPGAAAGSPLHGLPASPELLCTTLPRPLARHGFLEIPASARGGTIGVIREAWNLVSQNSLSSRLPRLPSRLSRPPNEPHPLAHFILPSRTYFPHAFTRPYTTGLTHFGDTVGSTVNHRLHAISERTSLRDIRSSSYY